jgi:hypothetical protein
VAVSKKPTFRREPEEEYIYRSLDRAELFRKVRYGLFDAAGERVDKAFGYSYQSGESKTSHAYDNWERDKPQIADRIPFFLPELMDAVAGGYDVLLTAGEKDACASVNAWGMVATTMHQGESVGWDNQQIAWLPRFDRLRESGCERSRLWIVADRDPTGWLHAWRTYRQLLNGKVGAWDKHYVCVLAPAVHGHGADLADHIALGERAGSFDELEIVDLHWLEEEAGDALVARHRTGGAKYWQGSGPYAAGYELPRQYEQES